MFKSKVALTISALLLTFCIPVFIGIPTASAESPGFGKKCSHQQFISSTTAKASSGNWYKCSGSDFYITKSGDAKRYYLWEQIENPRTTSNAKPFQVCGALGKLVQTENYGELQCRVIWTNRVKALIWMKTGRS
jgi:hypothetical protein